MNFITDLECLRFLIQNPSKFVRQRSAHALGTFYAGFNFRYALLRNSSYFDAFYPVADMNKNVSKKYRFAGSINVFDVVTFLANTEEEELIMLSKELDEAIEKNPILLERPSPPVLETSQLDLIEIVKAFKKHPVLYIGSMNFPLLVSWFKGLEYGVNSLGSPASLYPSLSDFEKWLNAPKCYKGFFRPWDCIIGIESGWSNDVQFECFFRKFEEWIAECGPSGKLKTRKKRK